MLDRLDRYLIDLHQDAYLGLLDRFGIMRGTVNIILTTTATALVVLITHDWVLALVLALLMVVITTRAAWYIQLQESGQFGTINLKTDQWRDSLFRKLMTGFFILCATLTLSKGGFVVFILFIMDDYFDCAYVRDRVPPTPTNLNLAGV